MKYTKKIKVFRTENEKKVDNLLKELSASVFQDGNSDGEKTLAILESARTLGVQESVLEKIVSKSIKDAKLALQLKKDDRKKKIFAKYVSLGSVDMDCSDPLLSVQEIEEIRVNASKIIQEQTLAKRKSVLSDIKSYAKSGNHKLLQSAVDKAVDLGISDKDIDAAKDEGEGIVRAMAMKKVCDAAFSVGYKHGVNDELDQHYGDGESPEMLKNYSIGNAAGKKDRAEFLRKVRDVMPPEMFRCYIRNGVSKAVLTFGVKYEKMGESIGIRKFDVLSCMNDAMIEYVNNDENFDWVMSEFVSLAEKYNDNPRYAEREKMIVAFCDLVVVSLSTDIDFLDSESSAASVIWPIAELFGRLIEVGKESARYDEDNPTKRFKGYGYEFFDRAAIDRSEQLKVPHNITLRLGMLGHEMFKRKITSRSQRSQLFDLRHK